MEISAIQIVAAILTVAIAWLIGAAAALSEQEKGTNRSDFLKLYWGSTATHALLAIVLAVL